MDSYSHSTLFLPVSLNEAGSTLKKMSASIAMGQTTNWDITLSLFELPKETMEQVESESNLNNVEQNRYEHKST